MSLIQPKRSESDLQFYVALLEQKLEISRSLSLTFTKIGSRWRELHCRENLADDQEEQDTGHRRHRI